MGELVSWRFLAAGWWFLLCIYIRVPPPTSLVDWGPMPHVVIEYRPLKQIIHTRPLSLKSVERREPLRLTRTGTKCVFLYPCPFRASIDKAKVIARIINTQISSDYLSAETKRYLHNVGDEKENTCFKCNICHTNQ